MRKDVRELMKEFQQIEDPLNLLGELALCRALVVDFINRHDESAKALLAWHNSFSRAYLKQRRREIEAEAKGPRQDLETMIAELDQLSEKRTNADLMREAFDLGLQVRERADPIEFAGKPRWISDITGARVLLSEVTKIAARIRKFQSEDAISQKDFFRLMAEMGKAVETHVQDERTLQRIREDWLSIKLS